jgi:adenine C2-methylase RlmN of 23S rRNA A2503 and tRNA A37
MWRSARLVTKALINVLKDEDTLENARTTAFDTTTGLSKAIGGLRHEVLQDSLETSALATRSHLQVELMDGQTALHQKDLIAASKLTTTPGMELKSD